MSDKKKEFEVPKKFGDKKEDEKPKKPSLHQVKAVWDDPQDGLILVHTTGMGNLVKEYRLLDAALYNGDRVFNVPLDAFLSAKQPPLYVDKIASALTPPEDIQIWLWSMGSIGPEFPDHHIRSAANRASVKLARLKKALAE